MYVHVCMLLQSQEYVCNLSNLTGIHTDGKHVVTVAVTSLDLKLILKVCYMTQLCSVYTNSLRYMTNFVCLWMYHIFLKFKTCNLN